MDILDVLKNNNISKARFAHDLNLSRPTLDEYIRKYEVKESLPKSKYQIIFDSLFGEALDTTSFAEKYQTFKRLLKRDKLMRLDDLNPEDTDSIIRVVTDLKQYASKGEEKSQLIPFIESLTSSFTQNPVVDIWVKYFNYLNGFISNVEFTDIEKKYIGSLYHINDALAHNPALLKQVDDTYFDEYLQRRKSIIAANSQRAFEINRSIQEQLQKIIAEVVSSSGETDNDEEIKRRVFEKMTNSAN